MDQVCIDGRDGEIYCIDRFEAARGDASASFAGTDGEAAKTAANVLPWTNVEWADARAACEAVGRRLCTLEEWMDACDGVVGDGGTRFTYGDDADPSICVTDTQAPLPTGSRLGCVSGFGVFDLSGNVWEWTGTTLDTAEAVGGSFVNAQTHFCFANPAGSPFRPTETSERLGFRCCDSP
ncbi:MAG: formylglycine-generating enzyme family protein [Myxococcales bacterium]|nr:formylglycine-generating enzyme family protein [Myxococcales bacterium]